MKCPRSIAMLTVAGVGLVGAFSLSVPAGAQVGARQEFQTAQIPCPPIAGAPASNDCPPPPHCPPTPGAAAPSDCPPPPPSDCTPVPGGPVPSDCPPPSDCKPIPGAAAPTDCPPPPHQPCSPHTSVDDAGRPHVDQVGDDCPGDEDPCTDIRRCPPPPECERLCKKPPVIWNPKYTG